MSNKNFQQMSVKQFLHNAGGNAPVSNGNSTPKNSKRKLPPINPATVKKGKKIPSATHEGLSNSNEVANKVESVINQTIGSLRNDLVGLISRVEQDVKKLEARVSQHDENFHDVNARIRDLEQEKKNSQLEVSGLKMPTFVDYTSLKTLFMSYLGSINITCTDTDIVDAYVRQRNVKGERKSFLIITFAHEAIASRVLLAKISRDKANGNAHNIYFGHVLSTANNKLLMTARRLQREQKLSRAWFRNGAVNVIRKEGEERVRVMSMEHLNWLANYNENNKQEKGDSEYENQSDGDSEMEDDTESDATIRETPEHESTPRPLQVVQPARLFTPTSSQHPERAPSINNA